MPVSPTLSPKFPQSEFLKGLPVAHEGIKIFKTTADFLKAVADGEIPSIKGNKQAALELLNTGTRLLAVINDNLWPVIEVSQEPPAGVQIHEYNEGLGQFPRFTPSGAHGKSGKNGKVPGKVWTTHDDMVAAKAARNHRPEVIAQLDVPHTHPTHPSMIPVSPYNPPTAPYKGD